MLAILFVNKAKHRQHCMQFWTLNPGPWNWRDIPLQPCPQPFVLLLFVKSNIAQARMKMCFSGSVLKFLTHTHHSNHSLSSCLMCIMQHRMNRAQQRSCSTLKASGNNPTRPNSPVKTITEEGIQTNQEVCWWQCWRS
jgi:hypothetical protein